MMPLPSTANTCSSQIALSAWPPLALGRLSLFSLFRHYYCFVSRFLSFTSPLSYHPSLTRLSYSALLRLPSAKVRHKGRTPFIQTCACGSFPIRVGLVLLLQPIGTTMALTPTPVTSGGRSPRLSRYDFPTFRLQSHHATPVSLYTPYPAYRASFGLRHEIAGSSSHTAESSSLYCGLPVCLQLLSTPPRSDAVTFDYRALAYPDTDLHRANVAPSRAHNPRPRGAGY